MGRIVKIGALVAPFTAFLCYLNRDGLWYNLARSFNSIPRFTSLEQATKDDYIHMGQRYQEEVDNSMVARFIKMLDDQKGKMLGQPVDLREHGLQTATRAYRANETADIVVMSLFHDMTETIASKSHGDAAAGFLEPYLSPKAIWMLKVHEVFQGYYYFHHFDGDRDARDIYKDHEYYHDVVRWCENYDQKSFDPAYPSLPIEVFMPMIEEVFSREPYWFDLAHPKRAAVTGLAPAGGNSEAPENAHSFYTKFF